MAAPSLWFDALQSTASLYRLAESIGFSSISVRDEKTEYVVEAPTPGAKKEEIKIEIVGRSRVELTVEQASKDDDAITDGGESLKVAKRLFEFATLPTDANTRHGKVEYIDGMVRIRFPKIQEADNLLQDDQDAEHANQAKDVAARFEKIQELRAQLEKEVIEAIQAEAQLKKSRAEAVKEIAAERMVLAVI